MPVWSLGSAARAVVEGSRGSPCRIREFPVAPGAQSRILREHVVQERGPGAEQTEHHDRRVDGRIPHLGMPLQKVDEPQPIGQMPEQIRAHADAADQIPVDAHQATERAVQPFAKTTVVTVVVQPRHALGGTHHVLDAERHQRLARRITDPANDREREGELGARGWHGGTTQVDHAAAMGIRTLRASADRCVTATSVVCPTQTRTSARRLPTMRSS